MQSSTIFINTLKQPLVSIIVTTYNSSKYVLQTLESAKKQTYQNIELIVSDDCSGDNTIELCERWIESNHHWFVRTKLVSSPVHTGITFNFNRGLKAAKGDWIKFIAGDDILKDTCIDTFIKHINNSTEDIQILCGLAKTFTNNVVFEDSDDRFVNKLDLFFTRSARKQYALLLKANRIMAPAVLIKRSLLISMDGFDNNYPMLEDYPFWLKVTEKGIKIYGVSEIVTFYRIHSESVYSSALLQPYIINPFFEHLEHFERNYVFKRLTYVQKLERRLRYARYRLIVYLGNNRNNYFVRYLNACLRLMNRTSPCEIR